MVKVQINTVDIDPKTGTVLGFYQYGDDRPNILILSAINGLSASCTYTSYLLMKYLEREISVYGSVTVLPVANPLPFRLGVKMSPLDSMDLDSVFPGDERGSVTQRIAWEIWRRASQADYVILLRSRAPSCISHVSALHRDFIHVRNLATQIGLPVVVQSDGNRGSLITEVAHEGIPAVSIEMRGQHEVDAQAAVEVREAVLNFLRIKGIIPGEAIETSALLTGRLNHINAEHEGFFVPSPRPGEEIHENSSIGQIMDKEEVLSPYDGVLISISAMRYVFEGDIIANITPSLSIASSGEQVEREPQKPRKW